MVEVAKPSCQALHIWERRQHQDPQHLCILQGPVDMVYKCACTDAAILANYFCKF